jgi:DMSO/TMAO reductase YedYZ molybdopterin-dependent catalytic subunit
LLADAGADVRSQFLFFSCADDYYGSLDMATALHAQSLLCYEMHGAPLTREHGAPLRLIRPMWPSRWNRAIPSPMRFAAT